MSHESAEDALQNAERTDVPVSALKFNGIRMKMLDQQCVLGLSREQEARAAQIRAVMQRKAYRANRYAKRN